MPELLHPKRAPKFARTSCTRQVLIIMPR